MNGIVCVCVCTCLTFDPSVLLADAGDTHNHPLPVPDMEDFQRSHHRPASAGVQEVSEGRVFLSFLASVCYKKLIWTVCMCEDWWQTSTWAGESSGCNGYCNI